MTRKLIWLRYLSWGLIGSLFVYIFIDGAQNPTRAEIINNTEGTIAYKDILWTNNYASILCTILFVIGCALLIVVFCMRKSLTHNLLKGLLCLAQFVFCSYLWVLTDSYLLSFVTSNNVLCALLSYITFTVMFAFLFEFMMCLLRPIKLVGYACYALYLLELLNLINYIHKFIDRDLLIYPVHVISLATSIVILYVIRQMDKQQKIELTNYILYGYTSVAIMGIIALAVFYIGLDVEYTVFYTIGIILLCIFLTIAAAHKISEAIIEKADERAYKKLAYTDLMTGLKNKTAYIELEKQPLKDNSIFIVLDLNDLKNINDTYGHRMGDQVITIAAKTITKFFGVENCYRFGGDEFCIILNDASYTETIKKIDEMKEYMDKHNQETEVKIEFAIGYAKQLPGDTVQSIFLRADQAMYKDKFSSGNSRKQREAFFDDNSKDLSSEWYTKEIDIDSIEDK